MLRGALTSVYNVRSGADVLMVCTGAAAGKRLVERLRQLTTSGVLSLAGFIALAVPLSEGKLLRVIFYYSETRVDYKKFRWESGGEISNFVCPETQRQWGGMKQRTLCQRSSCVWRMIRNTPWTTNGAHRATLVFHRKEPTCVRSQGQERTGILHTAMPTGFRQRKR